MTTLAVRFDEELSVAHAIDGPLPCPRGILTEHADPWDLDNKHGTRREVRPCALDFGHVGDCADGKPGPFRATTTVCGLSLADLPFVPSPDGMKPCSGCFDGDEINHVEEAMFA